MHGEGALNDGFQRSRFSARIDLLFTMSDITRGRPKAQTRGLMFLANEN
jgi:hypothetical protein